MLYSVHFLFVNGGLLISGIGGPLFDIRGIRGNRCKLEKNEIL